jgi:membrane protease YdiL (CAAX protease family)
MTMSILTAAPNVTPASSVRSWLARHPILGYFAIAFGGTWSLLLVPVLARNGLGVLPFTVSDVPLMVLFVLSTLAGPTLGAIVMTAVTSGKPGLRQFFRRYVQLRAGLRWYALALLGLPLIMLLSAMVIAGLEPLQVALSKWPALFTALLPATLFSMIMPGLFEEPGWRGYALPRLQQKYGPVPGSLLLGALHQSWHLPVFFIIEGIMAEGPFNANTFVYRVLSSMVLAVIWTWIFNNARGSIFMAILLHGANNGAGLLMHEWGPLFSSSAANTAGDILLLVGAVLIIVFTRGRLSYTPGLGLPNTDAASPADGPALVG